MFHCESSYYSGAQRYRSASLLYVFHLCEQVLQYSHPIISHYRAVCVLHQWGHFRHRHYNIRVSERHLKGSHTNIRESFSLLGFYAESNYSFVQTFRNNHLQGSSNPSVLLLGLLDLWRNQVVPKRPVRNYHCTLRKMPKERNFIYTTAQP